MSSRTAKNVLVRLFAAAILACTLQHPALAAVFQGESCVKCHQAIRDASPTEIPKGTPVEVSPKSHDVIVVGGGVAGLTAAYELRNRDVLVLEKEDRVGGKVRVESWNGRKYPVAAGYMAEAVPGPIKTFLQDLGIKGAKIPDPGNGYFKDGKISHDLGPEAETFLKDMAKFSEDPQIGGIPPLGDPSKQTALQKQLDTISLWQFINQRYGARMAKFSEQYSRSIFGIGSKDISAWAGLTFMSADFGAADNVSWLGGPGLISEKLFDKIGPARISTGAWVTRIESDKDGATVDYLQDGLTHRVRARAAVVAVPSLVANRIVVGLPDWKRAALAKVRYSAYAVAIIASNEPIYRNSFDLWAPPDSPFTDLEVLDWVPGPAGEAGADAPKQLLQAFIPYGKDRQGLISTSDDVLTRRTADMLDKMFPGAREKIHGIRIIRWGHAMPVDYPKYLTDARPDIIKPAGNLFFAGVDGEMPAIEGAIASGVRAAEEARRKLPR